MRAFHPLLLSALLTAAIPAQGGDLSVLGGWSPLIDAGALAAGAGSDFRTSIESPTSETRISILNTSGSPWTLWVRQATSSLPSGVTLSLRRTTSGSGAGDLTGGQSYLSLDQGEQALFSGTGDRTGIGLQWRLDGVSIRQGPGVHGGAIQYRVD